VRALIRVFLVVCCSGHLLGVFAQNTTTQTGFAIVTLVSGNGAGLIATETLRNHANSDVEAAAVAPSPLLQSASILVPVGPIEENTTALAIANPSLGSGGVNLILTNSVGIVVLNTVFRLGPNGQFSGFLNEFFAETPSFGSPLLLTISAEIPVAITAFNFRGADFTVVPLTSLSFPTPVPIQSVTPTSGNGTFNGIPLPTTPTPVLTPPVSTTTTPTIGGASALVFSQFAAGGDWSTDISIGNTSAGIQTVRIDFFSPNGVRTGSVTNIVIPSRGVFRFSTDPSVTVAQ
jgi:hypothetical protein